MAAQKNTEIPPELLGLEAKIRELAARGELTHFSITPVAGKGPGGVVWAASYSPSTIFGSGFGRDADPVQASMMAFKDVRLPKMIQHLSAKSPEAKAIVEALDKGELPPPDAEAKLTKQVKAAAVDDSDFI